MNPIEDPTMNDRVNLRVSDERLLELARNLLRHSRRPRGLRKLDPDMPLMIHSCRAKHSDEDGSIVGFVVTVLVDPRFGIPVDDPSQGPVLGSEAMVIINLDANGELLKAW